MDSARKSISNMMSPMARGTPKATPSAAATPMSISAETAQEAGNPLFLGPATDLARAAAPSGSAMSVEDPADALKRAAAPNGSVSSSPGPSAPSRPDRTPNSTRMFLSNPLLMREMNAAGHAGPAPKNNQVAHSPGLGLETEDPAMNSPVMNSNFLSSANKDVPLTSAFNKESAQNMVIVPARYIKEKTWGTPRRRICTIITLIVIFIIFVYLIARLVDTLNILNSTASLGAITSSNLCSSKFPLNIGAMVNNPSGAYATVNPLTVEIWYGNVTAGEELALLGYVYTQPVEVYPGDIDLAEDIEIEIPLDSAPHVHRVANDYLAGKELPLEIKIPLSVSFPSSMFIFPLTLNLDLDFDFVIPSMNAEPDVNATMAPTATPEEEVELIQEVKLPTPQDPVNHLLAQIGVKIFGNSTLSMVDATLPPISLDVSVNGYSTASIQTMLSHIGYNLPENQGFVEGDEGMIRARAALADKDKNGITQALQAVLNGSGDLELGVVMAGVEPTSTEFSEYTPPEGGSCYLNLLLEGLSINQTISLEDLFSSDEYEAAGASSGFNFSEIFTMEDLDEFEVVDVTSQAVLQNRLAVNLAGLNNFYNFEGDIPSIQVQIATDAAPGGTEPEADLLYLDIPEVLPVYVGSAYLNNAKWELSISSVSNAVDAGNEFLLNGNDINLHLTTPANGAILSRLLSDLKLSFSVNDILGGDEEAESTRRMLRERTQGRAELDSQRQLDSSPAAFSVDMNITAPSRSIVMLDLNLRGFDTDFFGGVRIKWAEFEMKAYLKHPRGTSDGFLSTPIIFLESTAYDTGADIPAVTMNAYIGDALGGEYALQMVENITNYEPVYFRGEATYNNGPQFGDEFAIERRPSGKNASTSGAVNSASTLFQLWHGELVSIVENEILTNIYFGIDLGDSFDIHLKVPQLDIAITDCSDKPYFVGIKTDRDWEFFSDQVVTNLPITIELEDASDILTAGTNFISGVEQRFCIIPHPSLGKDLPSNLVAGLVDDVAVSGMSSEDNDEVVDSVQQQSDVLDVEITSDANEACLKVSLTLTDAEAANDTDSISFGWGQLNMLLNTSSYSEVGDVMSINTGSGWFGPNNQYRQTTFSAPSEITPLNISLCFVGDMDLAKNDRRANTRKALQNFYEGIGQDYGVAGTLERRLSAGSDQISGSFRSPDGALDQILDAMSNMGGSSSEEEEEESEFFSLSALELVSFDDDQFDTRITFALGSLGFKIILPEISVKIGKLTTPGDFNTEVDLFDVSAGIGIPFGHIEQLDVPTDLAISLIPPQEWGDTLQLIDDMLSGVADVSIGSTTDDTAGFLSQVIPSISFSLSSEEEVNPPTPGPDFMDVMINVVSDDVKASMLIDFTLLQRLDYLFVWGTLDCTLYYGDYTTGQPMGHIYVPGQNLQEVGTGPINLNFTLFGAADEFAGSVFRGNLTRIGFDGTVGSNVFRSSFNIPTSITESISLGDDDSSDDAASSFKLIDAGVLGSSNVGTSGKLPCLFGGLCDNTILQDPDVPGGEWDGITGGATIQFELPKFNGVRWEIALSTSLHVALYGNGFLIGNVAVRPITVRHDQNEFSPVASFIPNSARIDELRATISQVLDGYDTVFTLTGSTTENYISKVASGISQDVPLVDVAQSSEYEPSTFGELKLGVKRTTRSEAVVTAGMDLLWNAGDLVVSAGDIHVEIRYGHTRDCQRADTTEIWCLNGELIAEADIVGGLVLTPSEEYQALTVEARAWHDGEIEGRLQGIVDKIVSDFVWTNEMPLEIKITITPPAGNKYGFEGSFDLEMYLTLPKGAGLSGFIDAINVDVLGTITSSLGDINIVAEKVLFNTMDFPIIISYYQYAIALVDTDGVDSDGLIDCGFPGGGLNGGFNPCAINTGLLPTCYGPNPTPQLASPDDANGIIKSAQIDTKTELRPATSIMSVGTHLMPGQRGGTELTIAADSESAVRLVDEMLTKGVLCGDIKEGIVLIAIQGDIDNCDDDENNRLEKDLQCTFPVRIIFDLTNYALSDGDTCASLVDIPSYLPFTFYPDGLYQFDKVWGISGQERQINQGSTIVTVTNDNTQSFGVSDNTPLNIEDSFQIEFEFKGAGGCGNSNTFLIGQGAGEGFSLNFMADEPAFPTSPKVNLNCGALGGCDDRYGVVTLGNNLASNFASLVIGTYRCNTIAWVLNGDINNLWRSSQSAASRYIDDNNWGTVTFTYDAHDFRAQVRYEPSGQAARWFDFDLNLREQLAAGTNRAYVGITATTGQYSCSTFQYRNLVHRGPRTNGLQTTQEGEIVLVKEGEIGEVTFRARDENGRKRGRGGNTWTVQITADDSGNPANEDLSISPRVVDNADGTYTVRYRIYVRGRYTVSVACDAGSAPDICNNSGQMTAVTSGLFVRK